MSIPIARRATVYGKDGMNFVITCRVRAPTRKVADRNSTVPNPLSRGDSSCGNDSDSELDVTGGITKQKRREPNTKRLKCLIPERE